MNNLHANLVDGIVCCETVEPQDVSVRLVAMIDASWGGLRTKFLVFWATLQIGAFSTLCGAIDGIAI